MSDKRPRDLNRRRDRRKVETTTAGKPFLQAPIILDRRERSVETTATSTSNNNIEQITKSNEVKILNETKAQPSFVPFMKRPNKFNSEAILKTLTDHPGHFVIGIVGKQGVGKSTILSHFTQDPQHAFPTQSNDQFLYHGHKTEGIDMYITSERAILLDTEPISCWTLLDDVLKNGTLNGLSPDLWLEMESLYSILFLFSICNVVLVVNEGPDVDLDMLQLIQRAEMLKFCIPDFPLLIREQQDMNYYPEIVFVCNKCYEFTFNKYTQLENVIKSFFEKSQLKTQGLVNLGNALPFFNQGESNLFFLPEKDVKEVIESFDVLIKALRDQVLAAPRRLGKKGHQVSEKDWYRNAIKIFELIRKSDYITEYLQVVRKTRDS